MTNLSKREKLLIKIFAAFLGTLACIYLIVFPIMDFKAEAESTYKGNVDRIQKLEGMYDRYRKVTRKSQSINKLLKNNRGVSSLIEENATKAGILGNKIYNRDHQSNIQNKYQKITTNVRFEGVDIKSLLHFIYLMENSDKLIKVSYLRISQALKDKYDANIKFDTFKSRK